MEIGNKPHSITPKRLRIAKDSKGNLFLILDKKAIEGEYREIESDSQPQKPLDLLASLSCKPEIKIRTRCPKEES